MTENIGLPNPKRTQHRVLLELVENPYPDMARISVAGDTSPFIL